MDNLEPITRNEMFLNGDDLEPITREEMILAGADLEPLTRHEWFLKKYRGSGDVTIERLAVTENGTYSESGKAYSPVVVNVPAPPIPENAYLLNDLSGLPANIASFTDGTDLPMASLKVAVTPYQDLHGYDGPWAGGAGKNKFQTTAESKTQEGVTYTVNDDGTISISGTATGYSSIYLGNARVSAAMGNVTISGIADATNIMWSEINVLDENGEFVVRITGGSQTPSITFDLSTYTDAYYISISVKRNSNTVTSGTIKPQVEVGSTATSFAPYSNICPIIGWDEAVVTVADDAESPTTSHEYTIDLDGTRYGGVLDATNGTMTVDRAYVDLGTLNWTNPTTNIFNVAITDMNTEVKNKIMCSLYPLETTSFNWASVASYSDQSISTAGNNYIYVKDSRYSSAADFKTAMSGVQLVYELATPITVQLAPTAVKSLEGVNNINANCGQITEVKYFKKA